MDGLDNCLSNNRGVCKDPLNVPLKSGNSYQTKFVVSPSQHALGFFGFVTFCRSTNLPFTNALSLGTPPQLDWVGGVVLLYWLMILSQGVVCPRPAEVASNRNKLAEASRQEASSKSL